VGDSIGRWEGSTLVVDTVGFNGYAELDARGQPTSAKLHTLERFTPSADGSIDIDTTIEDPEYYTQPPPSSVPGTRLQKSPSIRYTSRSVSLAWVEYQP
jgi:hypothetical protein